MWALENDQMSNRRLATVVLLVAGLVIGCGSSGSDATQTAAISWVCGDTSFGCICVDNSQMDLPTNAQPVALCTPPSTYCCALAHSSCACVTADDLAKENATCAEFYPPGPGLTPVSTCPPPP